MYFINNASFNPFPSLTVKLETFPICSNASIYCKIHPQLSSLLSMNANLRSQPVPPFFMQMGHSLQELFLILRNLRCALVDLRNENKSEKGASNLLRYIAGFDCSCLSFKHVASKGCSFIQQTPSMLQILDRCAIN